ncbi:MAG: sigma-70 family RNA polymerase sigma factor [Polaromonas sp.]|uniref:sigma-70 family RNA polymerase sigma factor n=1 Tax=Polaromonas sp. TaxID=1869339 RepID=UPI0032668EC9
MNATPHSITAPDAPNPALPEFITLMGTLRPRLHRYCARMTGSIFDGEDIVQDTLAKAAQAYDPATVQHAEGWLFRIAHNTAMDFLRSKAREEVHLADEEPDTTADPHASAELRHATTAALRTFMQLLPAQRSAVILADVLGYAMDEAADVMNVSLPAIKASLHRGRLRLRELAQQSADKAPPPALSPTDQALLTEYAARFNARDFDGLRDMLGDKVHLNLVARLQLDGKADVGEYFGRYSAVTGVMHVTPTNIEGRPAIWIHQESDATVNADYVVALDWQEGKLEMIRDFRYAFYFEDGAIFDV